MFAPDMSVWTGRDDTPFDGPTALRWHQCVAPLVPDAASGIVLLGFCSDEGVRRNGGRVGAKAGPPAIRKALANLAWHVPHPVYDGGDIVCDGTAMEAAQDRLAAAVAEVIRRGHRPLVLGGGHETAWGTFRGIAAAKPEATIGVINIDAHLDVRGDPVPNSGTPFRQIGEWHQERNRRADYLCLGVASHANTIALFHRARSLGGKWVCDDEPDWPYDTSPLCDPSGFPHGVDEMYVSLDLDVLSASSMPAVSAPAAHGMSVEWVVGLFDKIMRHKRPIAIDVVEFCPTHDVGNQGSRVAAYIVQMIAWTWSKDAPA